MSTLVVQEIFGTMKRIKGKHVLVGSLIIVLVILFIKLSRHSRCGKEYLMDQSFQHLFEYCNSPKDKKIAQEGIVPERYTLVSVHVVIRHGDRHNLHTIDNYKDIQIPCKMNPEAIKEIPEMVAYRDFMRMQTEKSPRFPDQTFSNWELFPDKDWCSPGELTPTGASQHVRNGLLMRKRYLNNFKLFGKDKDLYKQVLVRSTEWSRTYQSALALLFGLLQSYNVTHLNIETSDPALCHEKYSQLPCHCPLTAPYMDTMSATYHQLYPEVMNSIRTRNVINHYANVFDVSPKDVPKISNLMDIDMVHICHQHNLPENGQNGGGKCTDSWAVRDVYDIIQDNGRKQVKTAEFQKIAKLKYLPLLKEITTRLVEQTQQKTDIKFVLYSGHDTTINPFAIALNFSEGLWPPYASRIVMELYEVKQESKLNSEANQFFLKFLFNGRSVGREMEFCKKFMVSNSDLCPLNVFIDYVNNILKEISEQSYADACKLENSISDS